MDIRHASPGAQFYERGRELCRAGRCRDALDLLERAVALAAQEPGSDWVRAAESWLGLTLALVRGDLGRARRLCQRAVAERPNDPDLLVNLGRVQVLAGRKDLAFEAFTRAAAIAPDHEDLQHQLDRLGRRRAPVLRFLPRTHAVNRTLGRWRSRLEP